MTIPGLSKSIIQQHSTSKSFQRGEEYYHYGSVLSLVQRDRMMVAKVEGSEYEPYNISIIFDEGGILEARCSCPYDWGGWCKHIVASLIACLEEPKMIIQKSGLEESLKQLDMEELRDLIRMLMNEEPELLDTVDHFLASREPETKTSSTDKPTTPRQTLVNPEPIRKQVAKIIKQATTGDYEDYWDDDEIPGMEEIHEIVKKVDGFIENGDGHNAIGILGAITDAWNYKLGELEDMYGDIPHEFYRELDEKWAEAILSTELNTTEQKELKARLNEYGEEFLEIALTALEQGWDYPPLLKVFDGIITNTGIWGDTEIPYCADDLAQIRLRILERQERYQDYLNLAEAEGQTLAYILMLVQLGKVQDALIKGLQYLNRCDEAFQLAQKLRTSQHLEEALAVAEHGLTLEGHDKHNLALWTMELAKGMGDSKKALNATVIAFQEKPSLQDYLAMRELTDPEEWPSLRNKLLEITRSKSQSYYFDETDLIDIFLHEQLLDDAIKIAKKMRSYHEEDVQRVMDAVMEYNPEWVIEDSKKRAESIMDGGKAQYYHFAVDWLKKTSAAYQQKGQTQEWQTYYNSVCQKHARKYKLMELLKSVKR